MRYECPNCKQEILIWREVKEKHYEFDCWFCNTRIVNDKGRIYNEFLVDISKAK